MRLNNTPRAPGDCPAGQQWYVCVANGFTGCCSVDACDLQTCPDSPQSSSASQLSTTTLTVSATPSSTVLSSSSTTKSSSSSSLLASSSQSTTSSSTSTTASILNNAGLAGSTTPSTSVVATAFPTQTASSSSSNSNTTPIIAGVVTGVVVAAIMSILIWFCLRRRKQKKAIRESILQYGVPNKEFVLDRSTGLSFQEEIGDGVFAPFGGRYQSRSSSRSEPHPQPLPAMLPTSPSPHVSSIHNTQPKSRAQVADSSIPIDEVEDAPLPTDPEKAALTPPPEHEHPIYGLSNFDPHPGTALNPNLKPIHAHPATLRDLPSFTSGQEERKREQRYRSLPRRTSEVTRSTTTSRRHQLWRNSELMTAKPSPVSTMTDSPVPGMSEMDATEMVSPVPGRSELDGGEIPNSYFSPTIPPKISTKNSNHRGTTSESQHSIPIGLGVDSNSPTSLYSQNSFSPAQPQSQTPNEPEKRQQQMVGPKGLNLISPDLISTSRNNSFPDDSYFKSPSLFVSTREVLDGLNKEVSMSPEWSRWSGATEVGNLTPGACNGEGKDEILGFKGLDQGGKRETKDNIRGVDKITMLEGMGDNRFGDSEKEKTLREELTPLSSGGMSVGLGMGGEREWGGWPLH
ncbi:hypothetical protein EG329_012684 [Mollisiaceae sp. DMI_Dod_QoI]|nr:hypothetical protein EG329_012684 [Helotiales sp. DMI_Dod_QoI]